jgi:hypothetical protein
MNWRNGFWRYRAIEFCAVAVILAPLGTLAWWQLLCITLGVAVIEATAIAETTRNCHSGDKS